MSGPATPIVCDCGTALLPVGAISLICDGDVEHSETACIGCPTVDHGAAVKTLERRLEEIAGSQETANARLAEAYSEVGKWRGRLGELRRETDGIHQTLRTLRGQA